MISFRGLNKSLFCFLLILSCAFLLFGYSLLGLIDPLTSIVADKIFSLVLIFLCFWLPGIFILFYGVVQYNRRITITQSNVLESYFGRPFRVFSCEQITAYGYVSFGARDFSIFFCTLPEDQIMDISLQNKHIWQLWGSHRFRLRDTTNDRWEMDVAVAFKKRKLYRNQFITVSAATSQKLMQVVGLWKMKPLYIGPLLQCNSNVRTRLQKYEPTDKDTT